MIVVNGRFLSQRITGIQRFAYEICCALQQIGVAFTVLAPSDIVADYDCTRLPVEIIGGKGSHVWEQVTLPRYMKRHYNGLTLLSLSGLSPLLYKHTILTIHDISYLLHPRAYSRAYCLYYRLMTPLAAKRAEHILTVSAFSKEELASRLSIDKNKITVVYNAVRPQPLKPRDEQQRYLLAVGSLMPRKNIQRLLEAYAGLDKPDFALYIVGGLQSSFADARVQAYAQTKGIRFLGYVESEELMQLYRNATAYINPSLYEGFGIPVVEAMAQECPVVVSDIPVFREIGGDAALYFDPLDVQDIQAKILQIMKDETLRNQLRQAGMQQAKKYSWEQSAQTIRQLISA